MKTLFTVLVLAGFALAVAKAYEGKRVKITGTTVDAGGTRMIDATEILPAEAPSYSAKHFSFSCNEGVPSCETPAIDNAYTIETRGVAYKCDNYALCDGQRPCIRVCLKDIY